MFQTHPPPISINTFFSDAFAQIVALGPEHTGHFV